MLRVTERKNGSKRVAFVPDGESMTEQAHRDEVNINTIVRKYHRTGFMPTYGNMPTYGDFSETGTYQEALDQCRAAEQQFMTLPSPIRKRFRNDPGELIQFLSDPENAVEAQELGLVKAPVAAAEVEPSESSEPGDKPAAAAADGGTPVAASSPAE